jgi:hypothetical protein
VLLCRIYTEYKFPKKHDDSPRYAFFVVKKMRQKKVPSLPDKRLLERGAQLLSRMVEKKSCIIRQLAANWEEQMAFWRYLRNETVSIDWLIGHSLGEMKSKQDFVGRHLLSLQDSCTIGFKVAQGRKKGLKTVGTVGDCPGFIVHPNFLIDANDGRCLGLGDLAIFDEWEAKGDSKSQRACRNL